MEWLKGFPLYQMDDLFLKKALNATMTVFAVWIVAEKFQCVGENGEQHIHVFAYRFGAAWEIDDKRLSTHPRDASG